MDDVDILIAGGGLVGASLGIALEDSGLRVALAEAAPPKVDLQPSYDERNLALARATVNALDALGVWAHCGAKATPIRKIHVSRQGEFGVVRLDASRYGVDAFGATLPARELGNGLLARLDECRALRRLAPAKLEALTKGDDCITATLATANGTRVVRTRLLVGADGTQSFVRTTLGIDCDSTDYAQTAFVATVTPERAPDCAYERFTATGPVALLPLTQGRVGVVLTVPTEDAARVAALDDGKFIALLHERFGWRLGRLSRPGRRVSYPLKRMYAQRIVALRAVLVGNAAQTLHPIGAQGFNLGLRDALTLAELLIEKKGDAGNANVLADYARRRREDREGTAAASHALVRWTASESPPLRLLRSAGMLALDCIVPLQAAVARRGMGFRGHVPRLALDQRA